jgi:catechol 2,3-dioxygenase-like lactoylglutathione lyase family enzyme
MLLEGNLRGIQHLGIPVTDIDHTTSWYTSKLGFDVVHQPVIHTPEGDIRIAFLDKAGLVLEFYQLLGTALDEVAGRAHGHIDHFAMDVVDIQAALSQVKALEIEVDPGTPEGPVSLPQLWSAGVQYVFLAGAHGEKVEFNQRLDRNPGRRSQNLNGWSHLGIPVTDMVRSVAFYRQFGFKPVTKACIPTGGEEILITMLEMDGFLLELYQLLEADLVEIRARGDGHIDHFALDVVDVEQAFADLKSSGLTPLEEEPVFLPFFDNGVKYFNVRGPDGEKIEFNQKL